MISRIKMMKMVMKTIIMMTSAAMMMMMTIMTMVEIMKRKMPILMMMIIEKLAFLMVLTGNQDHPRKNLKLMTLSSNFLICLNF